MRRCVGCASAQRSSRSSERQWPRPKLFSSGRPQSVGSYEVEGVSGLEPGAYEFICTFHPYMVGTLNVLEQSVPAPPSAPQS